MRWFSKFDATLPVITAKGHALSSHGASCVAKLPPVCCIFHFSYAIQYLEDNYDTSVLVERTPNFLENRRVITVKANPKVCFAQGCYGSPAAVDLVETLMALGVESVISVGMCGGFSSEIKQGDIIIPRRVLCEEGTSHHYYANPKWIKPNDAMRKGAVGYFTDKMTTHSLNTVTTDAIYRQTFHKEKIWRRQGCVGVDMESSAVLSVSGYYRKPAVVILFVSDVHPLTDTQRKWEWDRQKVVDSKEKMVNHCITFANRLA